MFTTGVLCTVCGAHVYFIYRSRAKAVIGPSDVYREHGDLQGAWGPEDSETTQDHYIHVNII